MQAEDKMMEIAIAKLEVDEVVQRVDTVLKKIIDQIDKFSPQQIQEMLIKVRSQTAAEVRIFFHSFSHFLGRRRSFCVIITHMKNQTIDLFFTRKRPKEIT